MNDYALNVCIELEKRRVEGETDETIVEDNLECSKHGCLMLIHVDIFFNRDQSG